jgi:hypothetical protein
MRKWLIAGFGVLILNIPVQTAAAEEEVPLEIEPVYPENQETGTKGYFSLAMDPGEEQTVNFRMTNNLDEEVTLSAEPANAYTHPKGGILYNPSVDSPNTRLLDDAVSMKDYLSLDETVTLEPESSEEIPVTVEAPDVAGQTALGAVVFTTEVSEQEADGSGGNEEANIVLNTETSYKLAVQVNLPNESTPDFSVGEAGFLTETGQVFIEMTNNAHLIQDDILGDYIVTDSEDEEVFSGELAEFNMAPKSNIRYQIPWNNESLDDGDYTLTLNGSAGDDNFSVEEDFTIAQDDIEEYAEINTPEVNEPDGFSMPIWVWILAAALFGGLMLVLGKKLNRPQAKEE